MTVVSEPGVPDDEESVVTLLDSLWHKAVAPQEAKTIVVELREF
ncbi:MAG: hypothetical protein AAF845_10375 [Bacteroidota bacterium]